MSGVWDRSSGRGGLSGVDGGELVRGKAGANRAEDPLMMGEDDGSDAGWTERLGTWTVPRLYDSDVARGRPLSVWARCIIDVGTVSSSRSILSFARDG